ncbi:hypothetical protein D3C78_1386410 [compost metagenome]
MAASGLENGAVTLTAPSPLGNLRRSFNTYLLIKGSQGSGPLPCPRGPAAATQPPGRLQASWGASASARRAMAASRTPASL